MLRHAAFLSLMLGLAACGPADPEPAIALTSLDESSLAVAVRLCPGERIEEVRVYRVTREGQFEDVGAVTSPRVRQDMNLSLVSLTPLPSDATQWDLPREGAIAVEVFTSLTTTGATFDAVERVTVGSFWNGETNEGAADVPKVDCP